MPINRPSPVQTRHLLLLIFVFSGFAGLIYESIWTHYLKLFLGHAAYAQTLVLTIFMLGMATGSWLAGQFTRQKYPLLLLYALVELILGLCSIVFHDTYLSLTNWFFTQLAPQLTSTASINIGKWLLAACLIVPQSILIGLTFPLMANGLLRIQPDSTGRTLAQLYFGNSLGAACGVLTSGFILIAWIGLPGTNTLSGLINIGIALCVFWLARGLPKYTPAYTDSAAPLNKRGWILLAIAGFTGLASFIYEIVWIRLLSQLLGSATHSFELMLSAFILGLALGGYFIRKHVDQLSNPLRTLALIQITMGLIAFASLFVYNYSFELLQIVQQSITPSNRGYLWFNLFSHGLCLLVMLPATICAGMTLPIIIKQLLSDHGEASVGNAYAANTLGSIIGVLLAIHLLLPNVGSKYTIATGAFIDVMLGIILLAYARPYAARFALITTSIALSLFSALLINIKLDLLKLSSGVFLDGQLNTDFKIRFYQDGKTSTVAVRDHPSGLIILSTNGKPDASMLPAPNTSSDEATQTLSGLLPILLSHNKQQIGIIGFGSGMSTHAVLTDPEVQQVDTIEIEPAIVDAARIFYPKSYLAFDDPRSRIIYEDAKTWFAASQKSYGLIIAEPSNPWVSGVSSLFTTEFYQHIKRYLDNNGVFAQWIQTYELSPELLASIGNALGNNFAYYEIYNSGNNDLLFIASDHPLPKLEQHQALTPAMLELLKPLNIHSIQDLASLKIASKAELAPVFLRFSAEVNSDFYPVVDQNAVRARYLNLQAGGIYQFMYGGLPLTGTLIQRSAYTPAQAIATVIYGPDQANAISFYQQITQQTDATTSSQRIISRTQQYCDLDNKVMFWRVFPELFKQLVSQLNPEQLGQIWEKLQSHACLRPESYPPEDLTSQHNIRLIAAVFQHNYREIRQFSELLINDPKAQIIFAGRYLPFLWLFSSIQLQDHSAPMPFAPDHLLMANSNQNWLAHLLLTRYQQLATPLQTSAVR